MVLQLHRNIPHPLSPPQSNNSTRRGKDGRCKANGPLATKAPLP
jgi:hypothetical protein